MLHAPNTTDLSKNTVLVAAPEGYRREKDLEQDSRTSVTTTLKLFRRFLPNFSSNSQKKAVGNSRQDVVYMLVPGQHPPGRDLRDVWGGDQDVELEDDDRMGNGVRVVVRPVNTTGQNGCDVQQESPPKSKKNNVRRGWWRELASSGDEEGHFGGEPYIVRWDTEELKRLYHEQQSFILEKGASIAIEEVFLFTVLFAIVECLLLVPFQKCRYSNTLRLSLVPLLFPFR